MWPIIGTGTGISRLSGSRRILHVPRTGNPEVAFQHPEEVTR